MITDTIVNGAGYISYSPPIDYLGIAPTNFVTGELHTIANDGASNYCYINPSYGPFYANGVVVRSAVGGVATATLVLGTDYVLAFPFISASRSIGLSVFAAIEFINPLYSGQVLLQYRSLGGTWVANAPQAGTILNSPIVVNDPQVIAWEQVANYSSQFQIVTTAWDKTDSTTLTAVTTAISMVRDGLAGKALALDWSTEVSHMANFSNPHGDTAASVGLDYVANLKPATQNQANDSTNNSTYISAAGLVASYASATYQATTTRSGVAALNVGNALGDGIDTQKALTAAEFVALLANPVSSYGGSINRVQAVGQLTPFALIAVGSFTWNGVRYGTIANLMVAISAFCGVSALEYNSSTGVIWFPPYVAVPNLNLGA